jgi:hypothetical protein
VSHYNRVMKLRALRNITITLDEEVARWARIEAATNDTSVSRLIAALLKDRMLEKDQYKVAKRRALARPSFPKSDGPYLTRQEVHERDRLR